MRMMRLSREALLIVLALAALWTTGCGRSVQFLTIDADTGEPLAGVELQRKRTKHYGALRLEGETTVEMLGASNDAGRAAAGNVSGDDAILFDREGYWPAIFYADFPVDHVDSQDHDTELREKTGIPEIDLIRAIKARIRKQLGIIEGGEAARKRGDAVLVPLQRIGTAP